MKILLSDIYFRKSFDAINILKLHYKQAQFIYTVSSVFWLNKIKLKTIYSSTNYFLLRNDSNFNSDLEIISKEFSSEEIVYIPIEEDTTLNFLKFIKAKGELNFNYLLPEIAEFELSRQKECLNLFCEKHQIACPRYISEDVLKKKKFTYPIIKKPKTGSGSKGIIYIENEKDLKNATIDFDKDFIQERLPNPQEIEAGFYFCKKGELISFYSHKRIRTFPETGGVTIYSKSDNSNEIKLLGAKVLDKLNWSGLVMIEFLYDKIDEKYKLIEINPRLWGSILLSEFCGASFLKNYVEIASENNLKVNNNINIDVYIRWVFPYDILYWFKNISNPLEFFRKKRDTCYINFSYSSYFSSFIFIFFTYFNFRKIINIFKNE